MLELFAEPCFFHEKQASACMQERFQSSVPRFEVIRKLCCQDRILRPATLLVQRMVHKQFVSMNRHLGGLLKQCQFEIWLGMMDIMLNPWC